MTHFSNSTKNTLLDGLLKDLKRVETSLDSATESVEQIFSANPKACFSENGNLANYIKHEKLQAQDWETAFRNLLDYQPQDFEELKHKTLVLLEYANTGHDNPKIFKTIKNDMRMFSLEGTISQSQPHSFQLSGA